VATEGRCTVKARRQHAQENRDYEQPAQAQAISGDDAQSQVSGPQTAASPVPGAVGDVPAAVTRPQPVQAQDSQEYAEPAYADPALADPAQAPASQAPAQAPQLTIRRTRVSGLWVAIGCFAVVLLLLLIFILQNGHTVDISYFGAHGHLPLGVALLLATVCGVLLVVLAGTARILQLRAAARRHRRADKQAANQEVQVTRPRTPAS
jgi:lipopolysaccharide assembly protein A